MDAATISGLFNTVGLGGVFLWAAYYMLKRNEAQAAQQREEAIQRESRLVDALAAEQAYTRGAMTGVIDLQADGDIIVTGDVTASAFIGDGSGLTGITGSGDADGLASATDNAVARSTT